MNSMRRAFPGAHTCIPVQGHSYIKDRLGQGSSDRRANSLAIWLALKIGSSQPACQLQLVRR
jgi:hypothetical protein